MNLIRKLLLPFVPLYFVIVWFRNKLYDWGVKTSQSYDFPIIAVGNLSVGGTGKSPMVEYVIRLLKDRVQLATLSRGYKRDTKGFHILTETDMAKNVGDEPLQFKKKYPNVIVAVDENRRNGIKNLRSKTLQPDVVILDDAFQHRKVKAGLYILLTTYSDLYCDDMMLPSGNLREPRQGARRAHIIVVTKCPPDITVSERNRIIKKLQIQPDQHVFFSYIDYEDQLKNNSGTNLNNELLKNQKFSLVTGIANPKPLLAYYKALGYNFEHLSYPDHHNFSQKDIELLQTKDCIVTTEKDYVRLVNELPDHSIWYQGIEAKFVDNHQGFDQLILDFVQKKRGL